MVGIKPANDLHVLAGGSTDGLAVGEVLNFAAVVGDGLVVGGAGSLVADGLAMEGAGSSSARVADGLVV